MSLRLDDLRRLRLALISVGPEAVHGAWTHLVTTTPIVVGRQYARAPGQLVCRPDRPAHVYAHVREMETGPPDALLRRPTCRRCFEARRVREVAALAERLRRWEATAGRLGERVACLST